MFLKYLFFPKLNKVLPELKKGGGIFFEIEKNESEPVIVADTKNLLNQSLIQDLFHRVNVINKVREFSKLFNVEIRFNLENINYEKYFELTDACHMLDKPIEVACDEIQSNAKITIINEDVESYSQLINAFKSNGSLSLVTEKSMLNVFASQVEIPAIKHEFFDFDTVIYSSKEISSGIYETKVSIEKNEKSRYQKSFSYEK